MNTDYLPCQGGRGRIYSSKGALVSVHEIPFPSPLILLQFTSQAFLSHLSWVLCLIVRLN